MKNMRSLIALFLTLILQAQNKQEKSITLKQRGMFIQENNSAYVQTNCNNSGCNKFHLRMSFNVQFQSI